MNISNINCDCAGVDFILLSSAIAIVISKDLSPVEQNILGNFIQSIGQNLTVLASAQNSCMELKEENYKSYSNYTNKK